MPQTSSARDPAAGKKMDFRRERGFSGAPRAPAAP